MEQSNWSAAMLSLQMLKYYCWLLKKIGKRVKKACFLTEKNN
ncbi:hypothetical protein R4670_03880 [Acinetobacter baumannii]|nr:hypothetical protein [Acinetobacter baumannii]MDV7617790.1 hypothetical protein [Acinetobacter baumannii]